MAARLYRNSFVRFCVVGGIGVVVNYAAMSAGMAVGLPWRAAWACGVAAAITSNYVGNRYWAFRA